MTDEIQIPSWKPTPLKSGSDLLPTSTTARKIGPTNIPLLEEDDLEPTDIRLPQLSVLQGVSKVVQDGEIDGAKPGRLYFSANARIIEPPARLLVVHRFRGNAMFVRNTPEYAGLEDCISRDGVTGTKYGSCEVCKRCTEWREDAEGHKTLRPLGAKTQQLVVWLDDGIGILRIPLSNGHALRNMQDFQTRKTTTKRNWFAHPTLLFVDKHTNKDGAPFMVPRLRWDETQIVPDDLQHACYEWYRRVTEALEQGTLSEDDSTPESRDPEASQPSQASQARTEEGDEDIPF